MSDCQDLGTYCHTTSDEIGPGTARNGGDFIPSRGVRRPCEDRHLRGVAGRMQQDGVAAYPVLELEGRFLSMRGDEADSIAGRTKARRDREPEGAVQARWIGDDLLTLVDGFIGDLVQDANVAE